MIPTIRIIQRHLNINQNAKDAEVCTEVAKYAANSFTTERTSTRVNRQW